MEGLVKTPTSASATESTVTPSTRGATSSSTSRRAAPIQIIENKKCGEQEESDLAYMSSHDSGNTFRYNDIAECGGAASGWAGNRATERAIYIATA